MKKRIFPILLVIIVAVLISGCNHQIPFVDKVDVTKLNFPVNLTIYDVKGREMSQHFQKENRDYVKLGELPEYLVKAFVVAEDKRFYEHNGVDTKGVFRALYKDVTSGSMQEGASTITQQVAKNAFLSRDKTVERKLNEMAIAIEIENKYTKNEILQMYINLIYFGGGAYGVKTAAKEYFGKEVNEISISEAALLAGLPKAPSANSPRHNMKKAIARRDIVIELMRENGVITAAQADQAKREEIKLVNETPAHKESRAYTDYVIKEASKLLHLSESELLSRGYQIYTGFEPAVQKVMNRSVASHTFSDDRKDRFVEVGMATLEPNTGTILAIYGGRNYSSKALNHATAYFQPGSALKPLSVYCPAIEFNNWRPNSLINDEPMTFENGYSPKNYGGHYYGSVTLYEALARSLNVPAVYLLHDIGIETGARFVEAAGIQIDPKDRGLSLALGGMTKGASPLQMAQAYSAFPNAGIIVEAHAIIEIKDRNGKAIFTAKPKNERLMTADTAKTMDYMLQGVVSESYGTGRKAGFSRTVGGKTGTTQVPNLHGKANKDAWFVGYTNDYVTAIHVGYDHTDRTHYISTGGGNEPAELFRLIMTQVYK